MLGKLDLYELECMLGSVQVSLEGEEKPSDLLPGCAMSDKDEIRVLTTLFYHRQLLK